MVAINDLFDDIVKRAEAAKGNGIKPRLSRSESEYLITIPQGYKTRLYEIIITKGSKGISIQTYDRGKLQHNEKLSDASIEDVMKKLPLDFLIISGKDAPDSRAGKRHRSYS
jgi:hypothetical protein